MTGTTLAGGVERYLRSAPSAQLAHCHANDPGTPRRARLAGAMVVLAASGQDRTGPRFDISLLADCQETLLMASAPEFAAIAEWRRYAGIYSADLAMRAADGKITVFQRVFGAQACRRGGSPLRLRRPRFLHRRKAGAPQPAAAASSTAEEARADNRHEQGI